ncbi:MAG: DegV family EDD domain-containing protein [Clostridia bacterium]|nr:DegV family EDD domain-containing protein [Clostridia bacterium]
MSKRLVVGTSSGALYLAPERYQDKDIKIIPLGLIFKGEEYEENKVDAKAFYAELETLKNPKENLPRSSMAKADDIRAVYQEAVDNGYDEVIVVCLSSYLSGTYSLFQTVAKEFEDKLKITIVDTKICSFPEGYLCHLAKKLVDEGVPTEQIVKELEWVKKTQQFIGVDAKLDYLIYNGRLKGGKAFMGKMLSICPLVGFDRDGVLGSIRTVRTPKKALHELCKEILPLIGDRKPEDYILYHIYTGESILDTLKEIEKEYGIKVNHEQVMMTPGPGSSNGPWLAGYGLSFIRRDDEPLD